MNCERHFEANSKMFHNINKLLTLEIDVYNLLYRQLTDIMAFPLSFSEHTHTHTHKEVFSTLILFTLLMVISL